MFSPGLIVFAVIAGFAAAVLADRKGRSGTSWGVVTFSLPILVFVIFSLRSLGEAERKERTREGVNRFGIALGAIILLSGLWPLVQENPGLVLYSLSSLGFGTFVIWRSVR